MVTMTNKQRGVSLSGMLAVVVVLVFVAIAGLKVLPPYINNKTIQSQLEELSRDPELKGATVSTIRLAFMKRATMSNITAISAEDIEIGKDGDNLTLSANYTVKIPLVANATLVLEFSPSSEK